MTIEELYKLDPIQFYQIYRTLVDGPRHLRYLPFESFLGISFRPLDDFVGKLVDKYIKRKPDPIEELPTYEYFQAASRMLFSPAPIKQIMKRRKPVWEMMGIRQNAPRIDFLALPKFQGALIALTADDIYANAACIATALYLLAQRLKSASVIKIKRKIKVRQKINSCACGPTDRLDGPPDEGESEVRYEDCQIYDSSDFDRSVDAAISALSKVRRDPVAMREAQNAVALSGKALDRFICRVLAIDSSTGETITVSLRPEYIGVLCLGEIAPRTYRRVRRPPGIATSLSPPRMLTGPNPSEYRKRGRKPKVDSWLRWKGAIDLYLAKTNAQTRRLEFDDDGMTVIDLAHGKKRYENMPEGVVPQTLAEFLENYIGNRNRPFQPKTKDWRTYFKDVWADFRKEVLVEEPPKGKIEGHSGLWRIGP